MKKVDLNVDIGEGFPYDRELLDFATSANICLGFHAGSRMLTDDTYYMCVDLGIRKGAHPGYADRATMGRGPRPEDGLDSEVDSQIMVLLDLEFDYVKPHGTLYNESAKPLGPDWDVINEPISKGSSYDPTFGLLGEANLAAGEVAAFVGTLPLMGLPFTTHEVIARLCKTSFIRESFADRAYTDFGTLVPRNEPGAILEDPDEIKAQVLRLAPQVDSICLHGDTPNCLEFAELVYKTLVDAGYEVGY